MTGHRIFRDWTVLIACSSFNQPRFKELITSLGFAKLHVTDNDKQVPSLARSMKPNLVMLDRQLKVFSGIQLLSACRSDERCDQVPFLLVGDKADFTGGGLSERVAKFNRAAMVAEPLTVESLGEAIEHLVSEFIDLKKEEALRLFDEANSRVKADQLPEALELLEEATGYFEDNIDILAQRASVLTQLGRFDEAEKVYREILELDPNDLRSMFGLAEIYETTQRVEEAIDIVQKAGKLAKEIKLPPSQRSRIHYYVGEFDLILKRLQDASGQFEEAVDLDPENVELKTDIGDSLSSRGYYEESEKYYEDAMRIDPEMVHTYNRLGIAYRRQGKYDQALEVYRKALRIRGKDDHLLFNVARTLDESGQTDEAKRYLDRALRLAPDLKEAKALKASFEAKLDTPVDADEVEKIKQGAAGLEDTATISTGKGTITVAHKPGDDEARDRGTFGRFDRADKKD